jgi:hypothetical protein
MKNFNNNCQQSIDNPVAQNSLINRPFIMVHQSLKNNFPDFLIIDNPEEIPYYNLILGDEYKFYCPAGQSYEQDIKKN